MFAAWVREGFWPCPWVEDISQTSAPGALGESVAKRVAFRAAEYGSLPVSAKDQVMILLAKRKYTLCAETPKVTRNWVKTNKQSNRSCKM